MAMLRPGGETARPAPPPGLLSRDLVQTRLVKVRDIRCRPDTLACSCEEYSTEHQLVFLRRGAFVKHVQGGRLVADASQVVLFLADQAYRISHLSLAGDDCTVLSFGGDMLDEAMFVPNRRTPAWFNENCAPIRPAAMLASQALFVAAASANADVMAIEEQALGLLAEVRRSAGRKDHAPGGTARNQRLARAAQEILAADPALHWSLSDLARQLAVSPFHLARTFKAGTGASLHRYQTHLRLAAALQRILDGASDLAALALDSGFSSHSHFTEAFRMTFRTTPSGVRALSGVRRSDLRKNSIARRGSGT